MTIEDEDQLLSENLSSAVDLATKVATAARRQLASYQQNVEKAAVAFEAANGNARPLTKAELAMTQASAKAASSFADVLIDMADAAFDQISNESAATRQKALGLVRKVMKLAVDDTLQGAFDTPPNEATRIASTVELLGDQSWQRVHLPKATTPIQLRLKLEGKLGAVIHVCTTRDSIKVLEADATTTVKLVGPRPRLSLRIAPKSTIEKPAVALLHITGTYNHTIALTVRPLPEDAHDARAK